MKSKVKAFELAIESYKIYKEAKAVNASLEKFIYELNMKAIKRKIRNIKNYISKMYCNILHAYEKIKKFIKPA